MKCSCLYAHLRHTYSMLMCARFRMYLQYVCTLEDILTVYAETDIQHAYILKDILHCVLDGIFV